jgi:hypothetical protein
MKTKQITISNTIINQAISMGFDFSQFSNESTIQDIYDSLMEYFHEYYQHLPQLEDECEVINNGRSQHVSYGDWWCDGEIIDQSKHWFDSPDTKVYHSSFLMEKDGLMHNMNLYYLVGQTQFNSNL